MYIKQLTKGIVTEVSINLILFQRRFNNNNESGTERSVRLQ